MTASAVARLVSMFMQAISDGVDAMLSCCLSVGEVVDVRMIPEDIEKQVDGIKILPGYHMNKKHWITICLNGSVSMDEICQLIDKSYIFARK